MILMQNNEYVCDTGIERISRMKFQSKNKLEDQGLNSDQYYTYCKLWMLNIVLFSFTFQIAGDPPWIEIGYGRISVADINFWAYFGNIAGAISYIITMKIKTLMENEAEHKLKRNNVI